MRMRTKSSERNFGKKGLLEEIRKENEPELLETISPQHLENCLNGGGDLLMSFSSEQTMFHLLEKAGCVKTVSIYLIEVTRRFAKLSDLPLIQGDG